MNRAALAARFFLAVALLPAVAAAGYAAYEYRIQPPPPPLGSSRMWPNIQPLSSEQLPKGFLLGTYSGQEVQGLRGFDQATGHTACLTVRYTHWGTTFPADYVAHAAKTAAKTIIELQPRQKNAIKMADIGAGRGDEWLRKFADKIVSLRQPFILSFGPEMNGKWYNYGSKYVSGLTFVRAYRRVHDILLRDVRADLRKIGDHRNASSLITFMWQPSAIHKNTPDPKPYWPGSKYVDIIALDGYYYYPNDTFDRIFGKTITELRTITNTPIMIGETATGPVYNHQISEVKDLFAGVVHYRLLGLIWFDENQFLKTYSKGLRNFHQDWHLQDFPAELAMFRQLIGQQTIASYLESRAHG